MNGSNESTLGFACEGDWLAGVVHEPAKAPVSDLALLVIVGGPQYRAGSHRQFVLLCRAAAEAGFVAMRFDVRGMGDSTGVAHDFETISSDIAAAIEALQTRMPVVKRVALWGLCDGASAALLYLGTTADPRVQGLCLLNPWVRSPQTFAKAQVRHYYTARLLQRGFWAKLLSGKVGLAAWNGFIASVQARGASSNSAGALTYQQRMARAWAKFPGRVLLVLSGDDLTAKEFIDASRADPAWAPALGHAGSIRHDLAEADHTFSAATWRQRVEALTLEWLRATSPAPGQVARAPESATGRG